MTLQEHDPSFFDAEVNPLRERLFLVDHRIVRPNGEVVYSLQDSKRRRALGRHLLRRPARDYGHDIFNQSHEATMAGVRKVMRRRLYYEAEHGIDTPLPNDLENDVASLYGQMGANLEDLYEQRQKDRRLGTSEHDYTKRIGNLSEAAFFALFARSMTGEPSDTTIVIPSTPTVDQLGNDEFGNNMAYDFRVLKRGGEAIKLQTKTTKSYERQPNEPRPGTRRIRNYSPEILVLSLESVAGDRDDISNLHEAIIRDLNAQATDSDTTLIEDSTERLFKSIDTHIDSL